MRVIETITAVTILIIGIAMAVSSWSLGAGWGKAGPEAGFFPFWIGLLLSATAAGLIFQAVLTPAKSRVFLRPEEFRRVAKVALPAAAMVALIHFVGLYIATAVYLAVYMRWIGRHSWPLVIAISIGTPALTFLVFELWLATSLRKGPIEIWLGY